MSEIGVSTFTDTATALSLRSLSVPTERTNPSSDSVALESNPARSNRFPRDVINKANEQFSLRQQQRRFYPQNDLNFKTQQALSQYQTTQDANQLDELSQMIGVSVYV